MDQQLHDRISACLESIVDPCSVSMGAPAGLVTMGLVGEINATPMPNGYAVEVELYVTEPGCIMGALFHITAEQNIRNIPGVATVVVRVNHDFVWDPNMMSDEYTKKLSACRRRNVDLSLRQ